MANIVISKDASADDLAPLALALNEILRLPVTIRSASAPGVRVEKGKIIDGAYTGPILEEVLATGKLVRIIPKSGTYKGIPVAVAPIKDKIGDVIAALGVVDVVSTIDFPEVFGAYPEVVRQVTEWR
jgi:hypothetical protein